MEKIEVLGKQRLMGEIVIQGSKNSAIPILAASLLIKGTVCISNCPRISDVFDSLELLKRTGCKCCFEKNTLTIEADKLRECDLCSDMVKTTRTSVLMLGALLGRMKCAKAAEPGGCLIGKRPIDKHLEALEKMNVRVHRNDEYICCETSELTGCQLELDIDSVGVTENVIIAGVLARGTTIIYNAAREPEIVALCSFLNCAGAKIIGAGTRAIFIEGVKELHDVAYRIEADRIVAGTYLTAIAATHGFGTVKGIAPENLEAELRVLERAGIRIRRYDRAIAVVDANNIYAVKTVITKPFPGFPTDMQSQLMTLLSTARGRSIIDERVFESRFSIVPELVRMGADIKVNKTKAYINGVKRLKGKEVYAKELRGGAALVIAGLAAEGMTVISNSKYIKRGYEDICADLRELDAKIREV